MTQIEWWKVHLLVHVHNYILRHSYFTYFLVVIVFLQLGVATTHVKII